MKPLTKKQTLQLCKESRFLPNKLRQKFCGCLCCETESEELTVFSFIARIGPNSCGGRCVDTPYEEGGSNIRLYTTSPVYEFNDSGLFFLLVYGALLFYDEELTIPVTEMFDFISFTGCRFGYVNPENEFTYVICA